MSGTEQQFLIQNLKNMIDIIHQDTKTKVEQIKKDALSESIKGKLTNINQFLITMFII